MKLIWRILYQFYRLFSTSRYWALRRFTRAGLAMFVGLIVAMMMGPDTENNVAYQAFTLLLCMLTIGIASSWFYRGRFEALRVLPRFGTVGTPMSYHVKLKNLTHRTQSRLTLLETLVDPRPSFHDWQAARIAEAKRARSFRFNQRRGAVSSKVASTKETILPALSPNSEVEARSELTPLRRGLLRFSSIIIARPDPLGLFRGFARVPSPQTALILPKRYPLPPIALPGTMKYQAGGIALASNVGQSDEFVALRDYRHGDPIRHIHWRSWAKTGKPVVREFEDEFFVRHALVLDTFIDQQHSEAFEEAVSIAASFACSVQTQESLLDLLFVGPESYSFTAGRGLARSDQMLEVLASVQACRDRQFPELEHLVLNHVKAVSGCICVFLAWDEHRRRFVEKLRGLGVPLLVLVVSYPREGNSLDPGPMREEPDRFHVLEVGKVEAGLANLK